MEAEDLSRRPLIFGEVLFDVFPDGREILGGAPLNVAWHLQALGFRPLMVSRVGDDDRGRRILDHMGAWGMDVSGVQIDPDHPTGTVQVSLEDGEPHFEIAPDAAWDFIDRRAVRDLLAGRTPVILVHGTLAARSPTSAAALDRIRIEEPPIFLDVNLRDPWWTENAVQETLADARWAKLNERELRRIDPTPAWDEEACQAFCRAYGLDAVFVTRGARGARICDARGGLVSAPPPERGPIVDAVGAGDAFSAVAICGILLDWSTETILHRALDFAGATCRVRGATVEDPAFYDRFLREWGFAAESSHHSFA